MSDLEAQLAAVLSEYSTEVTQEVKKTCKDVSKEMTEAIRQDSKNLFDGTGKYAKGWRSKVEYEDRDNIRLTTYNATNYQLTHLLEFGHAKTGGGRVEGRPHISTNEEKAKKELVERIERAVQK